jgi:hypothetical protein
MSKWFYNTSTGAEQPAVILLLEGALVAWLFALDERGGHDDLRGSGRLSVIPYVHGRTELYPCPSLPCLSLFCFSTPPCEEVSTQSFYSSRPGSYNETWGPTDGPEVVETLYII